MYWLQRPPYLRWAVAAVLVAAAAAWEFIPRPTQLHPFLKESIASGEPVSDDMVEWKEIPAGMLPRPDLASPVAAAALEAGTPLLDPLLAGPVTVPEEWWSVPVSIGAHARPGDEVLLVVVDPPTSVTGTVVTGQSGDPYSLDHRPAVVAVPPGVAPLVAAASQEGLLVAAVRTASRAPGDG